MESLKIIFNVFFDNYLTGMAIGIAILFLVKLLSFICRSTSDTNQLTSLVKYIMIRLATKKVNKLGLQALAYSPLIDGRKITPKDAIQDLNLDYKNPLTIDQDHNLRSYVFNKDLNTIFYKPDDLTVKGYFHDLNTKKVYTGIFKAEQNNDNIS
ncbi:hypothetical protein V6380_14010 [Acinetobacter variabilis]|uniref:hypothetical protein n=1 Tax=Acinetobacter variabilis TaxID=70346 RepID=UPI003B83D0A7